MPKSNNRINEVTWKSLFLDLRKKSDLWEKEHVRNIETNDDNHSLDHLDNVISEESINCTENFTVDVSARFKPKNNTEEKNSDNDPSLLVPLHQRLALIKISNNVTSNKEALGILKERGEWFKDKWAAEECKDGIESEHGKEEQNALCCGVHSIDEKKARVIMVDQTKGLREFDFDHVTEISHP